MYLSNHTLPYDERLSKDTMVALCQLQRNPRATLEDVYRRLDVVDPTSLSVYAREMVFETVIDKIKEAVDDLVEPVDIVSSIAALQLEKNVETDPMAVKLRDALRRYPQLITASDLVKYKMKIMDIHAVDVLTDATRD